MATNIITVTAFTVQGTFNPAVSRVRNINVNQIRETINVTLPGNPGINGAIITPNGKIYTNQSGDAVKALANA